MTNDKSTKFEDNCPSWAHEQIVYLMQVEIFLGNIPKEKNWDSNLVSSISKKLFSQESASINENTSEFLFKRIVKGLKKDNFTAFDIATMINNRISYKGGPPYCDEEHVEAEF